MKMFNKIPHQRAVLYLIFLGLIPVFAIFYNFQMNLTKVEKLHATIQSMHQQALLKEKKQALNLAVKHHFRDADHFYIDKQLENMVFLEPEIESLQKIAMDPIFAEEPSIKKRIEFLTNNGNNLTFAEGAVQTFPFFQEVTETLVHPVEVNIPDLQKILAKIEGVKIGENEPIEGRPQLIILEFKIDKKKVNEKNDLFLLNMKLLKREFL